MSENKGVGGESYTRDELVCGDKPVSIPITLEMHDAILPRGQALGRITASGRYAPWDKSAVDGTATMQGILVDRKDTSSAHEPAAMYTSGPAPFNEDAISWDCADWGIDNSAAQIAAEIILLRDKGIVVKKPDRGIV